MCSVLFHQFHYVCLPFKTKYSLSPIHLFLCRNYRVNRAKRISLDFFDVLNLSSSWSIFEHFRSKISFNEASLSACLIHQKKSILIK